MADPRRGVDGRQLVFGDLLREYRLAVGLTQEALAERSGLSARGIGDLERGARRSPYRETIERLAQALHLSDEQRAELAASARRVRGGGGPAAPRPEAQASAIPVTSAAGSRGGSGTREHNLPAHLPVLIGRDQELDALVKMVNQPDTGLVTLVGVGGSGKTRLAVAVGRAVLDQFRDGVWLIELAPVSDSALLANTVLASLGVFEQPGRTAADQLVEGLDGRQVMLILDNCEHLVTACANFAADLLAACPDLTILATSREPLRVPAEHIQRVSTLLFPSSPGNTSFDQLIQYSAVQLFVDRAQAAVPAFALDALSAPVVGAICARLDGLPLAIELAAARVRVLAPVQILERLNDVFCLLVGGARTAPSRQQTMRATLDWSFDLLNVYEQGLFVRLAVFVGGWTLEAAEAVCQHSERPTQNVLESITGLIDKNLIQLLADTVSNTRFRMLEPVRQYALERLASSADLEDLRSEHARYYQWLAEAAEAELHGPEQALWYQRLEAEHDNLWHALRWCQTVARTPTLASTSRGEALERGVRLASSLLSFWWVRGHVQKGYEHIVSLMAIGEINQQPNLRARFLVTTGWMQILLGHYEGAVLHLQAGFDLAELTHDERTVAFALSGQGTVARHRGSYASARLKHEASLQIRRRLRIAHEIATSLEDIGMVAYLQGDLTAASAAQSESLVICRNSGDRRGVGRVLENMASMELTRGDFGRAQALSRESLTIWLELGDRWAYASSLERFAGLAAAGGKPRRALRLAGAAASVRVASGTPLSKAGKSELMNWLDAASRALGDTGAQAAWAEGEAMSEQDAVRYALAEPLSEIPQHSRRSP